MLNKRASAGQGSNDDFKHLIQVNARNFILFEFALCMKCFPSKQAETLFWQRTFFRSLFVRFWVSWR